MATEKRYVFNRSDCGIFAEVYFPKKAAYQGAIYDALREGYDEQHVKRYLSDNVTELISELQNYEDVFDPDQYDREEEVEGVPITKQDAIRRIQNYSPIFKGYSVYSVDGVFFDDVGKAYEEATQVIRLMFRFSSRLKPQAIEAGCPDVLRRISHWVISKDIRVVKKPRWHRHEKQEFLDRYQYWPPKHRAFAEAHFEDVAKEAKKWVDDCGLFVFGYLVRRFSQHVLKECLSEEEIWVASFFDLGVNVVKRVDGNISCDVGSND